MHQENKITSCTKSVGWRQQDESAAVFSAHAAPRALVSIRVERDDGHRRLWKCINELEKVPEIMRENPIFSQNGPVVSSRECIAATNEEKKEQQNSICKTCTNCDL